MTLAHGTDRLESARLVLRRIAPDDLPFFTRIHALPEVAQHLYPGGRPRSPEESAAWLQSTLKSYQQLALGYLAVLRKEDGALIGRCGLMDLVVESAAPEHGIRRGWFGDAQTPADVALTFECELGYTFDPAVWGQGFATEAVRCVRDYARGHSSAERPLAARRRTVRRASRRSNGSGRSHVGSLRLAARDRRYGSAPAGINEIGLARIAPSGSNGSTASSTALSQCWARRRRPRLARK
jgi:RimJ/RimL family protein N-acetyltransferase